METYSVRLTQEIAKRAPIEVIALPGRRSGHTPSALALAAFAVKTAARLLTAPPTRVVHVTDLASWPLALIAKLRRPRTRVVISAHGSDVSVAHRAGFVAAAYRGYLRLGSAMLPDAAIIANSSYVADLSEKVGFHKPAVVPLGTDLACAVAVKRDSLLFVGRVSVRKGLRFIVEEVLPRLPEGTRLRVAGSLWQDAERELLRHPEVDYVGILPPGELANEYGRAAVVLIPTRESEGFGLVAIEAASCGAFVIASAHSGLVDVVRPPIGITVPADDAEAWVAAIRDALSRTDEQKSAQAEASRMHVEQAYRWPRVADETWAIYSG